MAERVTTRDVTAATVKARGIAPVLVVVAVSVALIVIGSIGSIIGGLNQGRRFASARISCRRFSRAVHAQPSWDLWCAEAYRGGATRFAD